MKKKPGECCPVMAMVLARDTHGNAKPKGFSIGHMFHLNGKSGGDRLIYQFNRAKKTDDSKHGAKSEFALTTYAPVKHCPFCGEDLLPTQSSRRLRRSMRSPICSLTAANFRVTRIRSELASALDAVHRAEVYMSDYDESDSASLHELRAVIDDRIGWKNEAQEEAGDYLARLHGIAADLASARAQVELTEAERRALDGTIAWRQGDIGAHLLSKIVDELLALRAQEKAE